MTAEASTSQELESLCDGAWVASCERSSFVSHHSAVAARLYLLFGYVVDQVLKESERSRQPTFMAPPRRSVSCD